MTTRLLLILAVIIAGAYLLWRLLAKPAVKTPGTGVLNPVGGAMGWVNQALNTVNQVDITATHTADAADRVLTSAESIWNRLSTFGQTGDTGDN